MPRSLTHEHLAAPVTSSPLPWQAEPAEVFKRLSGHPGVVFLDSSDDDFGAISKWSFLSACPCATIRFENGQLNISGELGPSGSELAELGPFEALREFISICNDEFGHGDQECDFPPVNRSMAIGYIGYEMARFVESLPAPKQPPVAHPEMWFGYYPRSLAFRHSDRSWWLCGAGGQMHDLDLTEVLCSTTQDGIERNGVGKVARDERVPAKITPGSAEYLDCVEMALNRIRIGDFYQANLTRQVEVTFNKIDPVELYLRLRKNNPAPFAAALKLDQEGPWVLSSSPERFLRVSGRRVETRPIKGTVARAGEPLSDRSNRERLLCSKKDAAELAMIVDVLRNDLGRVCEYGSVRLDRHRQLETYARVHHLVSTVSGRLKIGADAVDLLKAAFPGGSITGAPKIKAIECLAELESFGRGVYTGAIGYIDSGGNADFSIAIRTVVLNGLRASFGVGGGIVADSDPETERLETLVKGSALIDALGVEGPIE